MTRREVQELMQRLNTAVQELAEAAFNLGQRTERPRQYSLDERKVDALIKLVEVALLQHAEK